MADAPDLKPCPFCGSDHIAEECGLDGQPYMSCVDCGANVEGKAGTWNTRADLARAAEAEAIAAGVRAGLLAAAGWADEQAQEIVDTAAPASAVNALRWSGKHARAIAADPAQVAAIAASVKGEK